MPTARRRGPGGPPPGKPKPQGSGTPEMVGKVGDRILGYLDPDGTLTTAKDRARVRAATVGEQRLDGMS
ncbi:DUF222 domain-containing protein, partial [Nocardia otitidiscaviarum]|uniref:DUF222 domain-containing protein n=1 Tax=Nocardia otitidiscaviarum TaxID=1823 RepID=UPI003CC7F833